MEPPVPETQLTPPRDVAAGSLNAENQARREPETLDQTHRADHVFHDHPFRPAPLDAKLLEAAEPPVVGGIHLAAEQTIQPQRRAHRLPGIRPTHRRSRCSTASTAVSPTVTDTLTPRPVLSTSAKSICTGRPSARPRRASMACTNRPRRGWSRSASAAGPMRISVNRGGSPSRGSRTIPSTRPISRPLRSTTTLSSTSRTTSMSASEDLERNDDEREECADDCQRGE